MKKNLYLICCILLVAGITSFAIYSYQHRSKPIPAITVKQALQERNTARQTLTQHDSTAQTNLNVSQAQVSNVTAQNAVLCAQIKTAKLVQPLCK